MMSGTQAHVVPGSVRAVLSVMGDAMSQTLENLERLIRMPFGCGEQNLMNMAPTTFAAKYLSVVDSDFQSSEWKVLLCAGCAAASTAQRILRRKPAWRRV